MKRKILSTIVVCSFLLLTMGCGTMTISSNLDDDATRFAEGKEIKDIAFLSDDEILDVLISNFSGARENHTGHQLSEDEADKMLHDLSNDDTDESVADSNDADETETPAIIQVDDRDDLKNAIHHMLKNTDEYFEFELTGSFMPDETDYGNILTELESEDAYNAMCVDTYSFTTSNPSIRQFYSVTYTIDVNQLKLMKEETRKLVDAAVYELEQKGAASDYEKVLLVNEYLCDLVEYPSSQPYEAESHTAWGALKKGVAVCDGYSRAAKLLLNELGVGCVIEIGECINGEGHAWNLIKVEGNWYQQDITWNDGASLYDNNARTTYFLQTDSFMKESRTWDMSMWPATPAEAYEH